MKPEFLEYAKKKMVPDDMATEDMRMLAKVIGVEAALEVVQKMAGARFIVPLKWQGKIAEKYILENPDNLPVKKLAVAVGVGETYVYTILNRQRHKKLEKNQTTLLDQI